METSTDLTITLPDDLAHFVRGEVETGRFTSSSEVIGAALRLLEARQGAALEQLREAWREGIESGDYRPLDLDTVKAGGRRRAGL